jgi:hypothetical protein
VEERALHGALELRRQLAACRRAESALPRATSSIIAHAMTIAMYRCDENAA